MQYNIVIIGAGQLGSRHLQGLKTADLPMSIYVVDNSSISLDTAKERYDQVDHNPRIESIHYLKSTDDLPQNIDLAIIATGSQSRRAIIETLLSTKIVRNLILEKVLFPSLGDYNAIQTLLISQNLLENTWINCPMRLFGGLNKLKSLLITDQSFLFELSGGNWGLACNTIHYLDLCAYLFNVSDYTVSCKELNSIIYPSKRTGYIEFSGTLNIQTKQQGIIRLTDTHETNDPIKIRLTQPHFECIVDEDNNKIITSNETFCLGMKYQSQLTGLVAEQILLRGTCGLTPYAESARLHLTFLQPLVTFYNNLTGKNEDNCPIT